MKNLGLGLTPLWFALVLCLLINVLARPNVGATIPTPEPKEWKPLPCPEGFRMIYVRAATGELAHVCGF